MKSERRNASKIPDRYYADIPEESESVDDPKTRREGGVTETEEISVQIVEPMPISDSTTSSSSATTTGVLLSQSLGSSQALGSSQTLASPRAGQCGATPADARAGQCGAELANGRPPSGAPFGKGYGKSGKRSKPTNKLLFADHKCVFATSSMASTSAARASAGMMRT